MCSNSAFATSVGKKQCPQLVIDQHSQIVLGPLFMALDAEFHSGLAPARKDGKYGYLNREGIFVIPATFLDAKNFSEHLAAVKVPVPSKMIAASHGEYGEWGYVDETGQMVIPPQFHRAYEFKNGKAFVEPLDSVNLVQIDTAGKIIAQTDSSFTPEEGALHVPPPSGELAPVLGDKRLEHETAEGEIILHVDKLFGYANVAGEMVIPPQFDKAGSFSEGLAVVCYQGKECECH